VILYEMLAGQRPFVGASPEQIMHHALRRPPRPLRALRRDISPALDAIVLGARLQKDPARRFTDAEDMLSALADLPVSEQSGGFASRSRREEQSTTLTQIAVARQSLFARLWSRVRYGRWRWDAGIGALFLGSSDPIASARS